MLANILNLLSRYMPAAPVVSERPVLQGSLALPLDLRQYICEFLGVEDLARFSMVNRDCRALALDPILWDKIDLRQLYPGYNVIGEAAWRSALGTNDYGLDLTGAPIPNKRELTQAVAKMSQLVENSAGVTLMMIPKGLTLNKILQIARDNRVPLGHISPMAIAEFGDVLVDETQVGLIANSVLRGSRHLSATDQENLCACQGYEMPAVVTAVALTVLTYISSSQQPSTRLFNDSPLTYTRCKEMLERKWNLVVGGFALSGLLVDYYYCGLGSIGVAGWRKFGPSAIG